MKQRSNLDDGQPKMSLTYREAASELRVSLSKLRELIDDGEITSVRLSKQILRVPRTEIEAYLARLVEQAKAERAKSADSAAA